MTTKKVAPNDPLARRIHKVADKLEKMENRASRRARVRPAGAMSAPEAIKRVLSVKRAQALQLAEAQQSLTLAQDKVNTVALGIMAAAGIDQGAVVGVDLEKLEVVVMVPKPAGNGGAPAPAKKARRR